MSRYRIVSEADVDMCTYEGATPTADAARAMRRERAARADQYELPILLLPSDGAGGGWTTVRFPSRADALAYMAEHPQRRMRCWARIERGEA